MSNTVQGKNVFAEVKIAGDFFPIFCAKTAVFTSVQEEIEVTSVNSSSDREYVPGMKSATMDVTGVTTSDNTGSRVSILYLMQAAVRRTVFEMRWRMTDDNGDPIALLFSAFSTTLSLDKALAGAFSQSVASFRITGAVTQTDIIPPPVEPVCDEFVIYKTLAEGATSVSDPVLEANFVEILGVARETATYVEILSGTPGNQQFKFTGGTGNGTIAFDPTYPGNPGGENIWILYKIAP